MRIVQVFVLVILALIVGCASPLSSQDPSARMAALNEITDDAVLAVVAIDHSPYIRHDDPMNFNMDVRTEAVKRISDPIILLKLHYSQSKGQIDLRYVLKSGAWRYSGIYSNASVIGKLAYERLCEENVSKKLFQVNLQDIPYNHKDGYEYNQVCSAILQQHPQLAFDFLRQISGSSRYNRGLREIVDGETVDNACSLLTSDDKYFLGRVFDTIVRSRIYKVSDKSKLHLLSLYDNPTVDDIIEISEIAGWSKTIGIDEKLSRFSQTELRKILESQIYALNHLNQWQKNKFGEYVIDLTKVARLVKDDELLASVLPRIVAQCVINDKTAMSSLLEEWKGFVNQNVIANAILRDDLGADLIVNALDDQNWMYILLMSPKIKHSKVKELLADKIPSDKIDGGLINGVKETSIRAKLKARMSANKLQEMNKGKAEDLSILLKKAEDHSTSTFELKGFYLGMPIEDAKRLLGIYLPDSNINLVNNRAIEVDVTHSKEFDVQPMFFCQADASGAVYRFNFDKKLLDLWFKYEVQTYKEWISCYSKEHGGDFRFRKEHGKKIFDTVWIEVYQESYRYKQNLKGYTTTYFGEKQVFDPNEEQTLQSLNRDAMIMGNEAALFRVGLLGGARAWVNNGFDNENGAKEGTLRVERTK